MNIRVQKRDNPYLQVDKTAINDADLSPQALGVLVYILAKPNDWKAHKREILKRFSSSKHCKTTANGMDSIFIELRKAGYIQIVPLRNEKGHVTGSEYVFCEMPIKSTEMPQSSMLGEPTEMPQSSEVGTLPTLGNLGGLKEERLSLIMNEEKENESAPAQTFELQDEKEKTAEPQAAQPYLNANAQKTYKSHLEIYDTLVLFWKANPEYTETINLMIEPLGMGSQFPNKRKAFFDHVENIFCTSIKKAQKAPLSAFELHDMIVQKIAYARAELSELKPLGGKEEAKEKKVAEIKNKPFISEEEESIIVAYCQDRTGYSYTTSREFRECQDIKAQRMYLQAKSNIENTKKYLINKNLIAA